jgi:type II secretory pathway pseudopilin PulG
MKHQTRGYTIVELVVAIGLLAALSVLGLVAWAAIHFVAKFW